MCVYRVQRGLSSRDVPFGPGEGAALYGGVKGIEECAWSVHSVQEYAWSVHSVARACVKAGVSGEAANTLYLLW